MLSWVKNRRKRIKNVPKNYREKLAFRGGKLVDQVVFSICAAHHEQLHDQAVIYFSDAVWGVGTVNKLDNFQISINQLVEPVVKTWLDSVDAEYLGYEQHYAVEYALRGWILARILYALERMKKYQLSDEEQQVTKQILVYQ